MAAGDDSIDAWSLPALLRAARRAYGSAIRADLDEAGLDDVPRSGIYVIGAIARTEAPLSEIIEQLGVSKQAAGALVDTLVTRGYLERSIDPEDRRRLTVTLTERGEAAAVVVRAAVERVDAALIARVGPEYVRTLARRWRRSYPKTTSMREGEGSPTAQRVAAYRLGFDRLPAPFGDPGADDRLARDVAGSISFEQREDMGRYLRWRTAFFDRVVLRALERNVVQVATVAAGYDGRSLRYARPGVRWFEVDHPDTQANKRLRLDRLGIDASHITFIGIDLAHEAVSAALIAGGWDPDAPSVMLCEGLSVYLEADVFEALLGELRAVATVGTRLAMSLSIQVHGPDEVARRARFEEVVAALGEPARNRLDPDSAAEMLAATRWRAVDVSERAGRAGFVVAAPVWEPAAPREQPTAGRIGRFMERTYYRDGMAGLRAHLEAAYGISVKGVRELDVGVARVARSDGPDWVARVFAPERPLAAAEGDAEILGFLEDAEFPGGALRPLPRRSQRTRARPSS